jgi:hypothetical protein
LGAWASIVCGSKHMRTGVHVGLADCSNVCMVDEQSTQLTERINM